MRFKERAFGLGWLERFTGSRGVEDVQLKTRIDFLLTGGCPGDPLPRGVRFPDPGVAGVVIDGKCYVDLAHLLEMKLACGMSAPDRPRDFDDVIQLIRVNALSNDFALRLHVDVRAKYRELWGYAQRPTGEY